jgi:hypothetical protein
MPSHSVDGWSVCLAAQEPGRVDPDSPTEDKRLNLEKPEVWDTVQKCSKRTTIGQYLNGTCEGCECKMRLDLQYLN